MSIHAFKYVSKVYEFYRLLRRLRLADDRLNLRLPLKADLLFFIPASYHLGANALPDSCRKSLHEKLLTFHSLALTNSICGAFSLYDVRLPDNPILSSPWTHCHIGDH